MNKMGISKQKKVYKGLGGKNIFFKSTKIHETARLSLLVTSKGL